MCTSIDKYQSELLVILIPYHLDIESTTIASFK